jgi:hypothetical protein
METPRIEAAYGSNEAVLGYVPSDTGTVPARGFILRQRLVQKISSSSLSRPELNKRRRAFEDARKQMKTAPHLLPMHPCIFLGT